LKPSDISALPKSAQDDWELNQSVRGTNTVDRASRLSILIEGVLAEGVAKRKRKKEKEREQGRKRERERERESKDKPVLLIPGKLLRVLADTCYN